MRDESQNALLKTLEEPPAFAHLILLSSEPEALLETIASRCQPVDFAAAPDRGAWKRRSTASAAEEVAAAARLSAGDLELARFLLAEPRPQAARRRPRAGAAPATRCALAAPAEGRRGRRRGRRGRRPRGARGGQGGRRQTLRPRDRRRGEAGRPPPPHRDPRPRPGALRLLVPRPGGDRRRRRGGRLQPRPPRRSCAPPPRASTPAACPPRRRARPGHPPPPRPQRLRGAGARSALLPPRGGPSAEMPAGRRSESTARRRPRSAASCTPSTPNTRTATPERRGARPAHARPLIEAGEVTVLLRRRGPGRLLPLLRFNRSIYTGRLDAYIQELYVVPERRGRGIGRCPAGGRDRRRPRGGRHRTSS